MKHKSDDGYSAHPSDRDPVPGQSLQETARRLANRPDMIPALEQFVDFWGLDGYDPFGAAGCSKNVRALVQFLIMDAKHIIETRDGARDIP